MQVIVNEDRILATLADNKVVSVGDDYPTATAIYSVPDGTETINSDTGEFKPWSEVESATSDSLNAMRSLKQSEVDGSMIRVIEDLVDAVLGLGGDIPQAAIDKVQHRKTERQKLDA